jgi:hypothetical protein
MPSDVTPPPGNSGKQKQLAGQLTDDPILSSEQLKFEPLPPALLEAVPILSSRQVEAEPIHSFGRPNLTQFSFSNTWTIFQYLLQPGWNRLQYRLPHRLKPIQD